MHGVHQPQGEGQIACWQAGREQVRGVLHLRRYGDVRTCQRHEGVQVWLIQDLDLHWSPGKRYRYSAGQPHHQLWSPHRHSQVHPQNWSFRSIRKKRSCHQFRHSWRCCLPGQPETVLQYPDRGTPSWSQQNHVMRMILVSTNCHSYHLPLA